MCVYDRLKCSWLHNCYINERNSVISSHVYIHSFLNDVACMICLLANANAEPVVFANSVCYENFTHFQTLRP